MKSDHFSASLSPILEKVMEDLASKTLGHGGPNTLQMTGTVGPNREPFFAIVLAATGPRAKTLQERINKLLQDFPEIELGK